LYYYIAVQKSYVSFMSTAYGRPQRGEGVKLMWTHVDRWRGRQKSRFYCVRHKWMTPKYDVGRD